MAEYVEKSIIFPALNKAMSENGALGMADVEDIIDDLPTADVQPVERGRWFHINDEGIVYCSECNNEAYWDTDYGQQLFDFCPYCGARMIKDGEQND